MHGKCHCSAVNCKNTARFNEGVKVLSFYRFPKDKERCALWVKNCGRTDLQLRSPEYLNNNCRLCSDHFEQSQKFTSSHKLVWNAIPTLFDLPNKPETLASKKRDLPTVDEAIKPNKPETSKKRDLPAVDEAFTSPQTQRRRVLADHGYCAKHSQENGPQLGPKEAENGKQMNNSIFQRTAASVSAEHGYCVPKKRQPLWVWKKIDPSLLSTIKPQSIVSAKSHKNDTIHNSATRISEHQDFVRAVMQAKAKREREKSTLRVKVWRLKQKIKKLEDEKLKRPKCDNSVEHIMNLARNYIEGPALDFFESQLTAGKRKKNGRRYSENVISMAMELYSRSRIAYKFLSKTFTMPHTTRIKRSLKEKVNAESENVVTTANDSSHTTDGNLHKASDCTANNEIKKGNGHKNCKKVTANNKIQKSNVHKKCKKVAANKKIQKGNVHKRCKKVSAAYISDSNSSPSVNNNENITPILLQVSEFTPFDRNLPDNATSERKNYTENCNSVSLQVSNNATNERNNDHENCNSISLKFSQPAVSDLQAEVTSERNNDCDNRNLVPLQISDVAISEYGNITPILLQFSGEI